MGPDRRTVIAGLAALPVAAALGGAAWAQPLPALGEAAAARGLAFGSALAAGYLDDPGYAELLDRDCAVWVPEWHLKWGAVEAERGRFDYREADAVIARAQAGGKSVRGHTLVWHEHLPEWIDDSAATWDAAFVPFLEASVSRYGAAIAHWDVVNEPIDTADGRRDGLRDTPFLRMRGPDYIAEAFQRAVALAPEARLYLNDFGLCYAEGWQEDKRRATLRLLEALAANGVPVHGLGIQGHLEAGKSFDAGRFARFLAEVAALGLEITITELDVQHAADGARAAEEVRKVLSVALDQPAVRGVVTWGLSDRYSWLRHHRGLPDNSGLPYDDDLAPTPMHAALLELFAAAPDRGDIRS